MDAPFSVLYLAANAFHVYVHYYLYKVLLIEPKLPKWVIPLCFSLYYIFNSSMVLWARNPYLNLLSSILPLVAISLLYKNNKKVVLTVCFMTYVVCMLLESFADNILRGFSLAELSQSNMIPVINAIAGLFLFLLTLIIKQFRVGKQSKELMFSHWIAIFVIPIGSVIIVVIAFKNHYSPWSSILIVSILLFLNVMVFLLFNKLSEYYQSFYEKKLLSEQIHAYTKQLQFIKEKDQMLNTIRHDIKNHMAYLGEYIRQNRIHEAQDYLERMGTHITIPEEFIKSENVCIDGFLNYKLFQISKLGVKISTEVHIPKQMNYPDFDLCTILGNLLDNAQDAFLRMPDNKSKELFLKIRFDRGMLYIESTNTYDGILSKKVGSNGVRYETIKDDKELHGQGLLSIEKVVKSFDGTMHISDENYTYTVEITLFAT